MHGHTQVRKMTTKMLKKTLHKHAKLQGVGISKKQIDWVVENLISIVRATLLYKGEKVMLLGFGTFFLKRRKRTYSCGLPWAKGLHALDTMVPACTFSEKFKSEVKEKWKKTTTE